MRPLATSLLLAARALAFHGEAVLENLGGVGTPADKMLFELINEETVDNEAGWTLRLQLYYKTVD